MSKTRSSKNYLIISCAHLGISERLLKVLKVYADYYKADAYHLGQLVTLDEKKMYEYRSGKTRAFNKIKKEADEQVWESKYLDKYTKHQEEFEVLVSAQDSRIEALTKTFGKKLHFVINDEQYFKSPGIDGADIVGHDWALSKHVRLESLSANGDKVSNSPITDRSFNFFRSKAGSFVVPHPTPAMEPFVKEGLNQSTQYWTTGGLNEVKDPKRASEYYKSFQAPSAVLVMVDSENGEFHPKRVKFDYFRDEKTHRHEPAILDDGLLFTADGVKELGSDDKGVCITDSHAKHEHKGVTKAFRCLTGLQEPATMVHAGDVGDWPSISRHLIAKLLKREGLRLSDCIGHFVRYLNEIGDGFDFIKKRVVIDANHEAWVDSYIAAHPELKGLCDLESIALMIPAWDLMLRRGGESKTFKFGNLSIRHGDKEGGVRVGSKRYIRYLCGHWHSHREFQDSGSMGAACGLGPEYLENGETSWTNTITSLTKYKGQARFNIKIVLHDESKKTSRFAYRNKIYEVSF